MQPLSGAFRKWPASRQRVQQRQGLALQATQCIPTMSQRRMKRESNARIAKISTLNGQNYLLPLGLLSRRVNRADVASQLTHSWNYYM